SPMEECPAPAAGPRAVAAGRPEEEAQREEEAQPEEAQPEEVQPEEAQPEGAQPEGAQPEGAQPEGGPPEGAQPEGEAAPWPTTAAGAGWPASSARCCWRWPSPPGQGGCGAPSGGSLTSSQELRLPRSSRAAHRARSMGRFM